MPFDPSQVSLKSGIQNWLSRWLEPEVFRPFVFGLLISITLSEFVRGALVFSLLPTYGRTVLGFAVEWTALALSMHYLADNLLRAPAGWLADRIGQRPMLLMGFAIAIGSVFLMWRAHSIPALIAATAVFGVGVSPIWPAAISGLALATPDAKRASFMGYLYIFWLIGTGAGPVIINLIGGQGDNLDFLLLVGAECLAFLLTWLLVRRPAAFTKVRRQPGRRYWRSLWTNVREVAFLFPGMFAQTFAVALLMPVLSLYTRVVLHLSGALYSGVLVAGGACTVALLIPAGKLVDRHGPRRFLVTGFLVAGSGLALYPLYHTVTSTFVTVVLLGISYAFILPAWNAVLDRSIDPDKKGALWGVFMTVEGFGSTIGPYLGGVVWDKVSPQAPFWVSGGVILVMGLLYLMLPLQARWRRLERSAAGARASVGRAGQDEATRRRTARRRGKLRGR